MPSSCGAREATGILNKDDADAVALDAVQQSGEARPGLDWIGASHGGIVELGDQACALGEALNGSALALVAVLVRADIGALPVLM